MYVCMHEDVYESTQSGSFCFEIDMHLELVWVRLVSGHIHSLMSFSVLRLSSSSLPTKRLVGFKEVSCSAHGSFKRRSDLQSSISRKPHIVSKKLASFQFCGLLRRSAAGTFLHFYLRQTHR